MLRSNLKWTGFLTGLEILLSKAGGVGTTASLAFTMFFSLEEIKVSCSMFLRPSLLMLVKGGEGRT